MHNANVGRGYRSKETREPRERVEKHRHPRRGITHALRFGMEIYRIPFWKSLGIALLLCSLPIGATAKRAPSDDEVREAVRTSLQEFPPTASVPADVEVSNGILRLTGQVENLPVKLLVSERAATVRGVRAIVNELEVRPEERPDDRIEKELAELLTLGPVRETGVTLRVNDGVVSLTGSVPTFSLRRLAGTAAAAVPGVRSVVNHLRVLPFAEVDDNDIRLQLSLRLEIDPWVRDDFVKFSVEEGVVRLYGAVDSLSEKERLISLAEVRGVIEIDAENLEASPGLRPPLERPHRPLFRSDDELKEALEEAFYQDYRIGRGNIEISVTDGLITLTGAVESIGAKAAAESVAADLPGGDQVFSFLTVSRLEAVSDDQIAEALRERFRGDSVLHQSGFTVEVEESAVTLSGQVETVYQRMRAMRIAANQPGVARVTSRLRIDWDG